MSKIYQYPTEKYLAKDSVCLILLILFAFALILPIIYFGIPKGSDLPQHYQFAMTYFESIRSGDFFPNWSAFENYGYGGIGIRIYPPLADYLLALTQFLTNDWYHTTWIVFWFWMSLGGAGIYLFAREWLSPQNSLLAGIIYLTSPFHLWQIYQSFFYSQFAAAAILPFCFLFLTRVCRGYELKNSILLGFFSAVLILTHLPATIVGFISMSFYGICILEWKRIRQIAPKLFLSGIICFCLSFFYLIRLISEMNLVNHTDSRYTSGVNNFLYGFSPHILYLQNLFELDVNLRAGFILNDLISIFSLVLILPFLIFIVRKIINTFSMDQNTRSFLAMSLTGFFAFGMTTVFSFFIWDNLPFLQKIQFPFRWFLIADIFSSITFVLALNQISLKKPITQKISKYLILIYFVFLSMFNIGEIILPSAPLPQTVFAETLDGLLDQESFDCWWTIWSKREAFGVKEKVVADSRQVNISKWEPEFREFQVEKGNVANARIATFYYPLWEAKVNDQTVETQKNPDGTILIPIPAENAKVSLEFKESAKLVFARIISSLSWGLLVLLMLGYIFKKLFGKPRLFLSKF